LTFSAGSLHYPTDSAARRAAAPDWDGDTPLNAPRHPSSAAAAPRAAAGPILLATWSFGRLATAAGWPYLTRPGSGSLDAVEQACRACEADPSVMTVGCGSYPDASGEISLDASIMRSPAECGSVCYVRRQLHAISIARLVMETPPHVMIAGEGAERLARAHGLPDTDLANDASRAAWKTWHDAGGEIAPRIVNIEEVKPPSCEANHDTVGVLGLDASGILAGACSTSGLAFKAPGRVGDSPIIGHGLYVDPAHGAAVATGIGERVMSVCGTFLAVECLRRGASPAEAAGEVLRRIASSYPLHREDQVGLIVLAPTGAWTSAALRPGFTVAVRTADRDELVPPEQVLLP